MKSKFYNTIFLLCQSSEFIFYLKYNQKNDKKRKIMYLYRVDISEIWKKVQANILKEPLVLLKLTISQQKALDLIFNLAPWKWAWHYHEAATPSCPKRSQKPSAPTYAFHGKEAWRPPDNATPTFRVLN